MFYLQFQSVITKFVSKRNLSKPTDSKRQRYWQGVIFHYKCRIESTSTWQYVKYVAMCVARNWKQMRNKIHFMFPPLHFILLYSLQARFPRIPFQIFYKSYFLHPMLGLHVISADKYDLYIFNIASKLIAL